MAAPQIDLSPSDFAARDPDAPVLDVRTPDEYAEGHVAGAVNVDVRDGSFPDRVRALDLPADGPVYLYCKSGGRSGQATVALREMGHAGALNAGGFADLAAAGAETA